MCISVYNIQSSNKRHIKDVPLHVSDSICVAINNFQTSACFFSDFDVYKCIYTSLKRNDQ